MRVYGSKDGLLWGMDVIGTDLWPVTPDLSAHEPAKKRLLKRWQVDSLLTH